MRGTVAFDTFSEKQSKESEKTNKKSPVQVKDKSSHHGISVDDSSGKKNSKKGSSKTSYYDISLADEIDINTLRKDKSLRDKARKELKLLELLSSTETDSSESSSSSDSYLDSSD